MVDNKRSSLHFSKVYFVVISIATIVAFMKYKSDILTITTEGAGALAYWFLSWLFLIIEIIIALVCFITITLKGRLKEYWWVLFYFAALLLFIFKTDSIILRHDDSNVRVHYAYHLGSAIGRKGMEKAVSRLLNMLNDENARVRVAAIGGLGKRQVKQAVGPFMSIIEKDVNSGVRSEAATFLGWINHPEGNDFLFNLFKSGDQESREIAFEGIRRLDNRAGHKYMEAVISALNDENENIRSAAVKHFYYYKEDYKLDQRLVEVLIPLLKDKSASVRKSVANALSGNLDRRIVENMLPLLRDPSSEVRGVAAYTLGGSGNPLAVEPLILASQDEDTEVRFSVIRGICSGGAKDRRIIEFLLKAYQENNHYTGIQMEILSCLGKNFGEEQKYDEYYRNRDYWWEKYNKMLLQNQIDEGQGLESMRNDNK